MSEKQQIVYTGGLNLFSIVYAAIIIMKIAGVITWSWWWITLPFWGGFALFAGLVVVGLIGYLILSIYKLFAMGLKNVIPKSRRKRKFNTKSF